MTRLMTFADLATAVLRRTPPIPVRLVAVDGPGGAGKSTFAARLAEALGGVPVVHTDDFASHEEPLQWWPLLEEWVLQPLAAGRAARFRPYDWTARLRVDWVDLPHSPVVVIEGVSAARAAARDRLTYSVWLQTGREERLRRGLERDGAEMAGFWDFWMAEENAFYEVDPTVDAVDLVVDGDPQRPHDVDREFVAIRP